MSDAAGRTEVVNVVREVGPRLDVEPDEPKSEGFFRGVFESAPAGLAVTRSDAQGALTIVRTNDAFTRMFGYRPHELDGKDPSAIRLSPRQSRGATDDRAQGEGSLVDTVRVRRYARSDGTPCGRRCGSPGWPSIETAPPCSWCTPLT